MIGSILSQLNEFIWKPFLWWVVVAPWEQGLRVRLGKTAVKLCPGIHFRIPFLDRVYVQTTRLRVVMDHGQTLSTADGHAISLSITVQYCIQDIQKMFLNCYMPEGTLLCLAQNAVANIVSGTTIKDMSPSLLANASGEVGKKVEEWGLGQVSVSVNNYAVVKTYRLITQGIGMPNYSGVLDERPR